jgi:light-regulated signal transduction histidine kinase (bacteriophytochrome)
MEQELNEGKLTINIEPIPELFVNPGLMSQLFQNLISNAIKYRRKDVEPSIKISAETEGSIVDFANPGNCLIIVEDNGIGFDQKYSEEIFVMLKKLHSRSEYEGAGIGLTLCRKIAELHKGFIHARGIENGGATFTLSLPMYMKEPVMAH